MSYSTDFYGAFSFSHKLTDADRKYLTAFSKTRRMKRYENVVARMADPLRKAVKLHPGDEGCFFVGGGGNNGQECDPSVSDYNAPPRNQPSLWCHWRPDASGQYLGWTGGEGFQRYVEWLDYILLYFCKPWKLSLSGSVSYCGQDNDDYGMIHIVSNNVIKAQGETTPVTNPDILKHRTTIGYPDPENRAAKLYAGFEVEAMV